MIKGSEFKGAAERLRRISGCPKEVLELLDQAANESSPLAIAVSQPRDHEESETRGQLAAALAKAQGVMHAALKDRENKHLRTFYADLASVWAVAREPLSANGLAVLQRVSATSNTVTITTELLHASGEWMRDRLVLPVDPIVSQQGGKQLWAHALGSAMTYGRRYALSALIGIAAEEEDDDGNATAGGRDEREQPTRGNALEQAKAKLAARGEPTAVFGSSKTKGRKLSAMATDDLTALLEFGRKAVKDAPAAAWAPEWTANCAQIESEIERRLEKAPLGKEGPF